MPSVNSLKVLAEGEYYHVYNRGVNKQRIYFSDLDYQVFLGKMKRLLDPKALGNMSREVELVAYCLMPNHFHMLLLNKSEKGVETFMRKLMTSYVMYINHKYKRVGGLFQGVYKAAHIAHEDQYQHITRYIHLNPHTYKKDFTSYSYSSIRYYLGTQTASWVHPELVEHTPESYERFCRDYIDSKEDLDDIKYAMAHSHETS